MNEDCNKFEQLFIQEDEKELLEHIKSCPKCKQEYENLEKVSNLIKEVSFEYRKKAFLMQRASRLAASFLFVFISFSIIQFNNIELFINDVTSNITQECSYEDMGLPVDEYGLIMVDSEN